MLFPAPPPPPVQDPSPQLQELVVTAPRSKLPITTSEAKVTVVTGEELVETGERSLPRALGRAAGVWIQESNLGGGAPVIRGLLGNQILIVVDGVRLNDSTTRFGPNQSLNTLDPAVVERVEVIHGSRSVIYGSDAIGGVVAIWTKRRRAARQGGDTGVHTGYQAQFDSSTDGWEGALDLSAAGERVGALGILGAGDWDDLRAGHGETQDFTGYRSNSAFGSVELALDDDRTVRVMSMFHRDFDVPRTFNLITGYGQTTPTYQLYDFALQERETTIATYDDADVSGFADRMQVRLSLRRYREQRERQRTGSTTFQFGETEVDTVGLGADFSKALGDDNVLTFGFEVDSDEVDSFGRRTDTTTNVTTADDGAFAPNARYLSSGVFVQDELLGWAPTYLTLGLRWSYFDFAFDDPGAGRERGDFDALTASIEAARDLSDDVRLTATLAQGFQAPNLEDLANDGDFAGGLEMANPDLDPAESLMAEVAVDVRRRAWSTNAAVFWTRIDDYIGRQLLDVGDPGTAGDELYLRKNAGRVELWGVELAGRRALGGADGEYALEGRAAWVRGRQYDDTVDPNTMEAPLDGVELRRVPPLNGSLGVRWDERDGPELLDRAGLWLHWAADQDELHPEDVGDPRIDPNGTDGWTVWTLDLGGALAEGVRWDLSFVNLFDELYRVHGSGQDAPGRSVVVGLRASF